MPIFEDQSGRGAGAKSLRLRGLVVGVVLALVATVLYQLAEGNYEPAFDVTVVADSIGEGLTPGAEVKFRGLTIGSVKTLESVGYNKQKLTLILQPGQATALRADTSARFTSSNVFGTAAVELVSNGGGAALTPGRTLVIGKDAQSASITGLLRDGAKFTSVLDSPEVDRILEVLRKHRDLIEPVAESTFDTIKILMDSQTVPISQSLSVIASFVNGVNDLLPLTGQLNLLLDELDFVAVPGGADKVNSTLLAIGKFLGKAGTLLGTNAKWLAPLTTALVNIGAPTAYALGSLAPAYDRISGLIDRTSTAFPVVDGKVRLRVDVLLDAMPGLANSLPAQALPAEALPAEAPVSLPPTGGH